MLKSRGLRIGNHVDIFAEYPFDSIYPGLITIGDYVTISSDVKILAHDASMGYITDGVNILVSGNLDSGILETDIPEEGNSLIGLFTTYQVVRYCQAQSRFAVL